MSAAHLPRAIDAKSKCSQPSRPPTTEPLTKLPTHLLIEAWRAGQGKVGGVGKEEREGDEQIKGELVQEELQILIFSFCCPIQK